MMAAALPLLTWPEDATLARLATERDALIERIERLPRMSHKRVELTARLRQLTADQLRLAIEREARP